LAKYNTFINNQKLNKMSKETFFAVRSTTESWHLYNAFAEELKAIGFTIAEHFNPFNETYFQKYNCIGISSEWNSEYFGPSFTFTSSSDYCIILEKEWELAIEKAKEFYKNHSKPTIKLNREYTALIDYNNETVEVGCQSFTFNKIHELFTLIIKK